MRTMNRGPLGANFNFNKSKGPIVNLITNPPKDCGPFLYSQCGLVRILKCSVNHSMGQWESRASFLSLITNRDYDIKWLIHELFDAIGCISR